MKLREGLLTALVPLVPTLGADSAPATGHGFQFRLSAETPTYPHIQTPSAPCYVAPHHNLLDHEQRMDGPKILNENHWRKIIFLSRNQKLNDPFDNLIMVGKDYLKCLWQYLETFSED